VQLNGAELGEGVASHRRDILGSGPDRHGQTAKSGREQKNDADFGRTRELAFRMRFVEAFSGRFFCF
jgi:hypothetical protein